MEIKRKNDATIVKIKEGTEECEIYFFREQGKRKGFITIYPETENQMDVENKENTKGNGKFKNSKFGKFDFTLLPPALSICPLWNMNLKPGEYVKMYGTQRCQLGQFILKGKFIKRIEDFNEYTNYMLKVIKEYSVRIQGELKGNRK